MLSKSTGIIIPHIVGQSYTVWDRIASGLFYARPHAASCFFLLSVLFMRPHAALRFSFIAMLYIMRPCALPLFFIIRKDPCHDMAGVSLGRVLGIAGYAIRP